MFRVGPVLGRSIWILRRNVVVFGILALLFTWPLALISDGGDASAGLNSSVTEVAIVEFGDSGWGPEAVVAVTIAITLGAFALYLLASCTMVFGTVQALQERQVDIWACVRRGLPAVPRVFGIAILSTLAIALVGGLLSIPGILIYVNGSQLFGGLLVLAAIAVPGLMIYSALWVAVPVAVVENTGVVASMKRSAMLTRGYRWRVFGIVLLLAVLNALLEWIAILPFDIGGMAYSLTGIVVTAIFTAWGAVAAAVAYHDLRLEKEGIGVNQIAAVFD